MTMNVNQAHVYITFVDQKILGVETDIATSIHIQTFLKMQKNAQMIANSMEVIAIMTMIVNQDIVFTIFVETQTLFVETNTVILTKEKQQKIVIQIAAQKMDNHVVAIINANQRYVYMEYVEKQIPIAEINTATQEKI